MTQRDEDKTPILLHPLKRKELFERGQSLFNDESFFQAHEVWEELWHLEQGRDRTFVQGLILVCAHLVHIQKGNWNGAMSTADSARAKLRVPPAHRLYLAMDAVPLTSALDYNAHLLAMSSAKTDLPPPVPEAFLIPKFFEK